MLVKGLIFQSSECPLLGDEAPYRQVGTQTWGREGEAISRQFFLGTQDMESSEDQEVDIFAVY